MHYAALKDNVVTLHDLAGKEVQRFPAVKPKLRRLAFSPDGKVLLGGCAETAIVLWNVAKNEEIRTLEDLSVSPRYFALSPDGRALAIAGESANMGQSDPPKWWLCGTGAPDRQVPRCRSTSFSARLSRFRCRPGSGD